MFNSGPAPRQLAVLYDTTCGFCVSARRWLDLQPKYVPLSFVPAGSAEAARLFPELSGPASSDELIVVGDDGSVYRDAHAWIACLWSLREYREWATRLASPVLLPLARRAFAVVSRNRRGLSRRLGLLAENDLALVLQRETVTCGTSTFAAPRLKKEEWFSVAVLAGLVLILGLVFPHSLSNPPRLTDAVTIKQEVFMTYTLWTYAIYLALSIASTIWVAQTLHKNGRVFLVDAFAGDERLADSVNHLLIVGFYLVNVGYVALMLRETRKPADAAASLELLSSKVGLVLLVLGAMHFLNLYIFSRLRRRALLALEPLPVPASGRVTPQPTALGTSEAKA